MNVKRALSQAALTAAMLWTGVANAALVQFNLAGDYTAQWTLDSNAVPDDFSDGEYFRFFDVPGFPDAAESVADIFYYSAGMGGGLGIVDFYGSSVLVVTDGPQLYTGTEQNPTFTPGTFGLTEYQGSGTYTLTVTNISAVPEPATCGMLLGGLGLMGLVLRRRRQG